MLIPAFSARYVHNASDPLLLLHHLVNPPKIALHDQELSLHVRICYPIHTYSSLASSPSHHIQQATSEKKRNANQKRARTQSSSG